MTENKNNDQLLTLIIEGVENVKGENISIIDLRSIENTPCDYFVICDANSNTQVNAISGSIQKVVSKEIHEKPWHIEGTEQGAWVLMDYVHVVVHIFLKDTRAYYNIEDLWGDAPITNLQNN